MKLKSLVCVALLFMTGLTSSQVLDPKVDYRTGAEIKRNAKGEIIRSTSIINAFKKLHPCPSNGSTSGACPGWAIDHVISLDCGGKDAVYNMQWLPNDIKSSSNKHAKDRFERRIYCPVFQITP